MSLDDFTNLNSEENNNVNLYQFSIIIAAKNEESNISKLISAIKNLQYSKDNYEVIIVDDSSNDDTFHLAKKLAKEFDNITVVSAINKKYEGKRGALNYGISLAKYPIIVITDADCVPETYWLWCLSTKFLSVMANKLTTT